jgi:hypothetical protein
MTICYFTVFHSDKLNYLFECCGFNRKTSITFSLEDFCFATYQVKKVWKHVKEGFVCLKSMFCKESVSVV